MIRLGRHRSNQLQIEDDAVAKRHAVIELSAERATLIDLAAEPGVRVNGHWIDEAVLAVGDRIQIGASEIVVEEIGMRDEDLPSLEAASAVLEGRVVQAAAEPLPSVSALPPAPPAYTYAMLRSGPAPRSEDVELTHVLAAEISILWGENVLHVAHLAAGQAFCVGDEHSPPCDFLIPREKLGVARMPLVLSRGSRFALVIAPHAAGQVVAPGGAVQALDDVRASAQASAALPGGRELLLELGTRAELRFGDIVFRIAAVRAGKPVGHGLAAAWDTAALPYFALSALSVGGLLSSMAFLVPPLALLSDEDSDEDRLYLLQAYLSAAAEREQQHAPAAAPAASSRLSGGGAPAAGQEGALGKRNASRAKGGLQIKGDAPRAEPRLSGGEDITNVKDIGMAGMLARADTSDLPDLWPSERRGSDADDTLGPIWSTGLGDAPGYGEGLSGTGERGGGRSNSIGMGNFETIGPGGGKPGGDAIALSAARTTRGHRTSVPRLREGVSQISGRLPPDTIQRVVRQNHPRFRACYEKGLMTNPSLAGRVGVRFVINRDGRVTNVANGGSDLPDPSVVSCVSRAFYDISFPKPEGGIVTVVYPIAFQPE
ncbi:MAG TPA: AgmX/PglI C-terminal domain-containing protein [Polyangiaceae bacterium]|nr:AgmX/PglI C-terminal domain-containing protein [Polyangiaceae bacterium]